MKKTVLAKSALRFVFGSLSVITLCTALQADDWRQWRGENRDGKWLERDVVSSLPEGQLPIDWSVEIGAGYSGPTVANGKVYVMDRQTKPKQTERILCFDANTGEPVWSHEYDARYTIGYQAGPRASVTIEGNRAYAVGAMGHLHCLDATTGKVVWSLDGQSKYDIRMPIWGIAASPLIYKDLWIQQIAGAGEACIVALDKKTGKEVWKALDEQAGYSSPIIIEQAGQDVLVCWTGDSLSGLNPNSGEQYWGHEMKPSRMPIGIGTPYHKDDLIFVSSFYDGSMMLKLSDQEPKSEVLWRISGRTERNTKALHSMIGTCVIHDDCVYGADSYGEFRCLDAQTGERIWEDLTVVPKSRWATVHIVEGISDTWLFNERGDLMIADLTVDGINIRHKCHVIDPTPVQLNRRGGVVWSHPAFADRAIFARNDSQLIRASLAK